MAGMNLLPCKKEGVCQECAVDHPPTAPHNNQSLYYQYKFYGEHGRWPTWQDAISHCDDETQRMWKQELTRAGHWAVPSQRESSQRARAMIWIALAAAVGD